MTEKVRPFSNGSEYSAWTAANCEKCAKGWREVEKCIGLYCPPGGRVGTSFAGVGSEMVTAIKMGRSAVGCELKTSYFNVACDHLRTIEREMATPTLFDFIGLQL